MSVTIASAVIMMASNVAEAPVYFEPNQYVETLPRTSVAEKVLTAVAGAAAAAAVYRASDDAFEYYPLEGRIGDGGFSFRETLSMERGGFRFQLSARRSGGNTLSQTPNFRKESRKMAKAIPGYPQPARLVIGVKVNY